ncbi:hypothetical protein EAE96_000119 [Botrytis aclada]|nr:hypothetical protein EAE96_000119 [Botrytis aclada]
MDEQVAHKLLDEHFDYLMPSELTQAYGNAAQAQASILANASEPYSYDIDVRFLDDDESERVRTREAEREPAPHQASTAQMQPQSVLSRRRISGSMQQNAYARPALFPFDARKEKKEKIDITAPSGEKATELTHSVWLSSGGKIGLPVAVSQSRIA